MKHIHRFQEELTPATAGVSCRSDAAITPNPVWGYKGEVHSGIPAGVSGGGENDGDIAKAKLGS